MNRNLAVGLTVGVAAVILLLAVLVLGRDRALFTPRDDFTLLLPNVEGLQVGSPVKLVGVQVGVVTDIRLPDSGETSAVRVMLSVNRSYSDRIREDTRANLRVLSLLGGEKYIELTLGSPDRAALPAGSEIQADLSDLDRMFSQGSNITTDLAEITGTLRQIFDRIQKQEGMLGRLLMDPTFGRDSLEDVHKTLASLSRITAQIEGGEGVIGAALSDPELRDRVVRRLPELLDHIDAVVSGLRDPSTPIGSILLPGGKGEEAIADVRAAAESIRRSAESLENGNGLAGRLLHDSEYADRVLGDLEATLRNVASITGKIDRGEGSVGAFVNDPAVYDGLRDVVSGLQDSRFLKWMVRRYGRKGAEARQEAESARPPG
jgi:phospholipid/cholesterol/gamma-HCH transport system substrate-binding protein